MTPPEDSPQPSGSQDAPEASPTKPAAPRAAKRNRGGKSRQRDAERPPLVLQDDRRRLWNKLESEFPFTPHFVRHGEHWLHFIDEGPPNAEALLLVHGNPTWSFFWRSWIERLKQRYRVVAIDLLGCGFSEKPAKADYTLAGHARSVEFLAEELGLENITLGLHDWGGAIGMNFARQRPELISRLVLTNTAAFPHPKLPRRIGLCRTPGLGPLLVRGFGGFTRAALRTTTHKPGRLPRTVRRGYSLPYSNWADRVAIQAFVEDIPMSSEHPSWNELKAVEQGLATFRDHPALILWGMQDWCFTPAILERWRELLPNAAVETFENAGHWLLEDEPGLSVEAVERFLAKHPLPQATAGASPAGA